MAAALARKVEKSISVWAPLPRRSTSPGLGVAETSSKRDRVQRAPILWWGAEKSKGEPPYYPASDILLEDQVQLDDFAVVVDAGGDIPHIPPASGGVVINDRPVLLRFGANKFSNAQADIFVFFHGESSLIVIHCNGCWRSGQIVLIFCGRRNISPPKNR